MKNRIWLLITAALMLCILLVLVRPAKQRQSTRDEPSATDTNLAVQPKPTVVSMTSNTLTVPPFLAISPDASPLVQAIATTNPIAARRLADWQGSIEFYGKAVDENSNALSGATVDFHWVELPDKTGNRSLTTKSDVEGLFSLRGERGPSLSVVVSKEGYYPASGGAQYGFTAISEFSPDPQNPVVFRLRKKGVAEPLIHLGGIGLHTMRDFLLTADGKPTEVSLHDGRLTQPNEGDFRVEFVAGPPLMNFPSRNSWEYRVTVPGGGLIQIDEEFPFLAPTSGYQEFDQRSVGNTNWSETVDKQYYVKLRDGNFGRVKLRVIGVPKRPFFRIESFLNPSGSRNLEPAE